VVRLLGPLLVEQNGATAAPASGRVSAILALLACDVGRVVAADRLIDQLWDGGVPASGAAGLHVYISRLRRLLTGTAATVVTRSPGYVLELPTSAVDVHLLATVVSDAEEAAVGREWATVLDRAGAARALWRGTPFTGAHPTADLQAETERLERLRSRGDELTVRALLALARGGEATTLTAELCSRDQLNETFWRLRMRTEHAVGNDAGALAAYEEFRSRLAEELGVDPSERMRRLHLQILRAGAGASGTGGAPSGTPRVGTDATPRTVVAAPTTSRRSSSPQPRPMAPSPIGRTREQAALEAAVAGALGGAGRTVVLEGEPGIGKSFLATHAAAVARAFGVQVVWARAGEGPGTPPWWLWEQVLETLGVDDPTGSRPSGAEQLHQLIIGGADEDADRARFRLCQSLVERVLRASRQTPLLVVLDDVQWVDDGTLQAVRLLAQRSASASCSVVVTARTATGRSAALESTLAAVAREESADRHHLASFSPAEVVAFLDQRQEHRREGQDPLVLYRRSGGNPFYLSELVRAGAVGGGPTGTVTDLVRQRLAALDDRTVRALELAAVAGATFAVPVVARTLTMSPAELVALLEPAAAQGFVLVDVESAQWRFAHDLAREALLGTLSLSRAAELHGVVADAIVDLHPGELDEHVDELADHRFLASLGVPSPEVFVACSAAADSAGRRLSYDLAALHRSRALVCHPPGLHRRRERFEVLLRLTTERRQAGDVVGASTCLQQAVELARLLGDQALLARAVAVLGGVTLWNWRQFDQVDHDTVALLTELVAADPAADPPDPPSPADPAEGSSLAARSGPDQNTEPGSHLGLDAAPTPVADADPFVRRRVELLGTLAVELYYDGDRPSGEEHAVEAVRLARAVGDPALLGRALNNYVIAAWAPGRDADRRAALDESLAMVGAGLPLATEVVARLHRASLRLVGADLVGAERDLGRAGRLARRLGLLEVEGQVSAQRAAHAMLRGDAEAAAELTERAHTQLAQTTLWGADWVELVQRATQARLAGQVHRVCEVLVAKAAEDAHRPLRWTAVLALAEAGEVEQARAWQTRWGLRTLGRPHWGSIFAWVQAAETSLLLGTPDPAMVYAALAPFHAQLAVAGTSVAVWGPIADVLARLAEVCADRGAVAAHREQANALTENVSAQLGITPKWPGQVR
jgi:DNA-binding SARP family transcriptional activator